MIAGGVPFIHEMCHARAFARAGCIRVGFGRNAIGWFSLPDGWSSAFTPADRLAISAAGDAGEWLATRMLSGKGTGVPADVDGAQGLAREWLTDAGTRQLLDLAQEGSSGARGAGPDFRQVRRELCAQPALRARLLPTAMLVQREAELMVRARVHTLALPLDQVAPGDVWVLDRAELDALTRGWPVAGRVEKLVGFSCTPDMRQFMRAIGSGIEVRHVVAAPAAGAACAERVDQVQVAPPRRDSVAQPAPMMGFRRGATVGARHLTLGVAAASARAAGRHS
jgi:hypothetical protein